MKRLLNIRFLCLLVLLPILTSCSALQNLNTGYPSNQMYSLGGIVEGLASGETVTLINNGTEDVTITGSGTSQDSFVFPANMQYGETYYLTISENIPGKQCTADSNSGTIVSEVTVVVSCSGSNSATTYYSIGGNVYGLATSLENVVLINNIGESITVTGDGSGMNSFVFTQPYINGNYYNVSIFSANTASACSISYNSGIISNGDIANITIVCGADQYEPDNTIPPPTSNLLSTNSSSGIHTLDTSADVDYFQLVTGPLDSGYFYIDVSNGSGGCNFDSYLDILDITGKTIASDDNSGIDYCSGILMTLTPATTYYIKVSTIVAGSSGSYVVGAYKLANIFTETFASSLGSFTALDLTNGTSGGVFPFDVWNHNSIFATYTGCGGTTNTTLLGFSISGTTWSSLSTDSAYAFASSNNACNGSFISTSLVSNAMDFSLYTKKILLKFDVAFKDQIVKSMGDSLEVQVKSLKTGNIWHTLDVYQTDTIGNKMYDISSYATSTSNVQIRYVYYSGGWAYYAMLDNVNIWGY